MVKNENRWFFLCLLFFMSSSAFSDQGPLFSLGNKKVSYSDLPINVRQEIYEIEKTMQIRTEHAINNYLMNRYVKMNGSTEVSENEARQWFEGHKDQVGGRSFDSIKKELIQYLTQKKTFENKKRALEQKLEDLKYKSLLTSRFSAPVFKIKTDGYPMKGKKNSPVTIIEFADYLCPHCKEISSVLREIANELKDKVKLVYIDFPVNPSGVSEKVAQGAYCAQEQGKFWDYNQEAFKNQGALSKNSPVSLAKSLKLDLALFNKCLTSETTAEHVEGAKILGQDLGVGGTPTIFINGVKQVAYSKTSLMENIKSHF